jgi:hypothetical protein
MRLAAVTYCCTAVLQLAACSPTGIRVDVTRDPAAGAAAPLDELRIFVGRSDSDGTGYLADRPAEQIALAGRDLATAPYRLLLLADGASETMSVQVGAIAFREGHAAAAGVLPWPLHFQSGKVLLWELPLAPQGAASAFLPTPECLRWADDGVELRITPADDVDCDGSAPPRDCNDAAGDISPAAPERCDNQVDDDCDGAVDEAHLPLEREYCDRRDSNCDGLLYVEQDHCYALAAPDECRLGHRQCDDGAEGWLTPCNPNSDVVPRELCDAYAACIARGAVDPLDCAHRTVATIKYACTLNADGNQLCGESHITLEGPAEATTCTWRIIGGLEQRGYEPVLHDAQGKYGPIVSGCSGVHLEIDYIVAPGLPTETVLLELTTDRAAPIYQLLNVELQQGCPGSADNFRCERK